MAEAILSMARLERKLGAAERAQDAAERCVETTKQDAANRIKVVEQRLADVLDVGQANSADYRRGYYAGHAAGKRGAEAKPPETRRRMRAV